MWNHFKTHPITWAVGIFVGAILLCGGVYAVFENSRFTEGVWWALVTAFTVGYGDYSPKHDSIRFFVGFPIMIIGISCVAICTAKLASVFVTHDLEAVNDTPELHDDLDACIHTLTTIQHELRRRETNGTIPCKPEWMEDAQSN